MSNLFILQKTAIEPQLPSFEMLNTDNCAQQELPAAEGKSLNLTFSQMDPISPITSTN